MKNSSHTSAARRRPQARATIADARVRLEARLRSDQCDVDIVHLDAVRRALASLPTTESVTQVAGLLAILANPTRLTMLLALQPKSGGKPAELCVCDLATVAGASKSLTSHQLRLLRTAGLVRQRRAGKLSFYRLNDGPLVSLLVDVGLIARNSDNAESPRRGQASDRQSTVSRRRGAPQA